MEHTQRSSQEQAREAEKALLEKNKHQDELLVLLGNLRHQLSDKEEQVATLESQAYIYRQEVDHLHNLTARMKTEAQTERETSREGEINKLNEELATLREELGGRQGESSRLKKENEGLRYKMEKLEADLHAKLSGVESRYKRSSPLRHYNS